jgi:predicted permease
MSLASDLRFALRTLARRPVFTAAVVLTLGLGIGANSTIFSAINAVLFTPLGVTAPERLLNLYTTDSTGTGFGASSHPDYRDLRDGTRVFEGIVGYSGLLTTLTGTGGKAPQVLFGEIVTGNYFNLLGVPLALGRGFLPEEDRTPGTHPVVVLSHGLWQRRFGGDPAIIGQSIRLNGQLFSVVGVAVPSFTGLLFRGLSADLWAPVMMMGQLRKDQLENRAEHWMFLKGRLAAGVTEAQALAAIRKFGADLAREHPESNRGRTFTVVRTTSVAVNPQSDRGVYLGAATLLAMVGLVLLIVCTNLANLMLARTAARRREMAVRVALGATRGRLARQLLTETTVLAMLGGLIGLVIAFGLARALSAFQPPLPVPLALRVGIDARVVGFTALASLLASVMFGLAPALEAGRQSLTQGLSGAAVVATRRGRFGRLRNAFLLPQLALSLVLLVVAGLFIRSVANAGRVEAGFDLSHTALVALDLRLDGYDEPRARAFYEELGRRLREGRGVTALTVTDRIPLDLYGNQSTTIEVPSVGTDSPTSYGVQYTRADAAYFETLNVPLVRGRGFRPEEIEQRSPVAVVSSYTAARLWPAGDALGARLRLEDGRVVEVIGIAGNTKVQTLGESPQLFLYLPFDARYARLLRLIARTNGDPAGLVPRFQREVAALDPAVGIFEARTLTDHLDTMLFPYRAAAGLASVLGLFGLIVAALGLYGVVAFGVAQRTREFGIRMALGAQSRDVLRQVLGESVRVVVIGAGLGLALALGVGRLLRSILFGIGPGDPLTMVTVTLLLAAVALFASWLPARRATAVAPAEALRE